jgi:Uma2 family endonuclease
MGRAERTRKGSYTWDDFVALPDDDRRELIDGELVEVEVPNGIHEYIVAMLAFYLVGYAKKRGGSVRASGYKVRITERRGVMPDVQYFAPDNEPDQSQDVGLVAGRPDIAIEIISKSGRRYDRIVKLGYYASIGVPEYWLVDPENRTLERLVHTKDGYVIRETLEGSSLFAPKEFRGLKIPLGELWTLPKKR